MRTLDRHEGIVGGQEIREYAPTLEINGNRPRLKYHQRGDLNREAFARAISRYGERIEEFMQDCGGD